MCLRCLLLWSTLGAFVAQGWLPQLVKKRYLVVVRVLWNPLHDVFGGRRVNTLMFFFYFDEWNILDVFRFAQKV